MITQSCSSPYADERALDRREHPRQRIAVLRGEVKNVVAVVAVLRHLLATPQRIDRTPETIDLRTGVVVVVLALDLVTTECEQPRDAVAVRAVPCVRNEERPGRVCRDHLDLYTLGRTGRPAAAVPVRHLCERPDEERVGEAQVDETGARDVRRLDVVDLRNARGQLRRKLPRRPPRLLGGAKRDIRGEIAVGRVLRPLELDVGAHRRRDLRLNTLYGRSRHARNLPRVWSAGMDDDSNERQLNIHMDPALLAGVYANFANITFSDYEFTLTFARIDHEVEEGDVPGVVVSRVNMSQQFMKELLAAMQDAYSKYTTVKGIQDLPETNDRG
jgi:hypothetical protein